MNSLLKQFIEKNIHLIEDNNFNELYNLIDYQLVSSLTQVLYKANINPLLFIEAIPFEFAYHTDWADPLIPGNIHRIGTKAFMFTPLSSLKIEEGCDYIGNTAFANCRRLESIQLPKSLLEIGQAAFFACPLKYIKYNGTQADWCNIAKGKTWVSPTTLASLTIECLDGLYNPQGDN